MKNKIPKKSFKLGENITKGFQMKYIAFIIMNISRKRDLLYRNKLGSM